jgi:hypothetical protein
MAVGVHEQADRFVPLLRSSVATSSNRKRCCSRCDCPSFIEWILPPISLARRHVTTVAKFLLIAIERKLRPANFASSPALTLVIMEPAMINWPEILHHAEDWAAGFWTGAATVSLIGIAGAAFVVLARAI